MDMLRIKFLSLVFVFCSTNLSCFMIVYIFKDKHKVAGDINSLNLLVFGQSQSKKSTDDKKACKITRHEKNCYMQCPCSFDLI